jgi:DNA-binding NarL/FixJ family response regulator
MKRVLIVDDHQIGDQNMRRLLSDLGARDVLTASNARVGYHSYVTQQPDIAIIDLKRGSDGLSLIRQMRIDSVTVVDALATAFVSKDAPIDELLRAWEFWQEKRAA